MWKLKITRWFTISILFSKNKSHQSLIYQTKSKNQLISSSFLLPLNDFSRKKNICGWLLYESHSWIKRKPNHQKLIGIESIFWVDCYPTSSNQSKFFFVWNFIPLFGSSERANANASKFVWIVKRTYFEWIQ